MRMRAREPEKTAPKLAAEEPSKKANGNGADLKVTKRPAPVDGWDTLLSAFGVDPKLTKEGVWVAHPDHRAIRFKIARLNLVNQRDRMQELAVEYGFGGLDELGEVERRVVLCEVLADTVLLGWTGIADKNGKAIKYSRDAAVRYIADERMEEFRDWLLAESSDREHYRIQRAEEDAEK